MTQVSKPILTSSICKLNLLLWNLENIVLRGWMDEWIVRNIKTSKTFFNQNRVFSFPVKQFPVKAIFDHLFIILKVIFSFTGTFLSFYQIYRSNFFSCTGTFLCFLRAKYSFTGNTWFFHGLWATLFFHGHFVRKKSNQRQFCMFTGTFFFTDNVFIFSKERFWFSGWRK